MQDIDIIYYYKLLGVDRTASKNEIKSAYKKLSKKFHPDVNDGDKYFEDRFKEINEAYEKLISHIESCEATNNTNNYKNNSDVDVEDSVKTHDNKRNQWNTLIFFFGLVLLFFIIKPIIQNQIRENAHKNIKETYKNNNTSYDLSDQHQSNKTNYNPNTDITIQEATTNEDDQTLISDAQEDIELNENYEILSEIQEDDIETNHNVIEKKFTYVYYPQYKYSLNDPTLFKFYDNGDISFEARGNLTYLRLQNIENELRGNTYFVKGIYLNNVGKKITLLMDENYNEIEMTTDIGYIYIFRDWEM